MKYIKHYTEIDNLIKILKDKKIKISSNFDTVFFTMQELSHEPAQGYTTYGIQFKLKDIIEKYKYYVFSPQYNYANFRYPSRLSPRLYNLVNKIKNNNLDELEELIKNDQKMPELVKQSMLRASLQLMSFVGKDNLTFDEVQDIIDYTIDDHPSLINI